MKKKLITVVVVAIISLGVFFGIKINKELKTTSEFVSFRENLDEDYFPLLKESGELFNNASSHLTYFQYTDWQVDQGFDQILDLQNRIEDLRKKVINTDLTYQDSLELKKNVLNTLNELDEVLDDIYNNYYMDSENYDLMQDRLGMDVEELSGRIEEMNEQLEKYYD
jgi:peptidoglycan hydrolase CwlO-like protein